MRVCDDSPRLPHPSIRAPRCSALLGMLGLICVNPCPKNLRQGSLNYPVAATRCGRGTTLPRAAFSLTWGCVRVVRRRLQAAHSLGLVMGATLAAQAAWRKETEGGSSFQTSVLPVA